MKLLCRFVVGFMAVFLSVLSFDTERMSTLIPDNAAQFSIKTHDIISCGFIASESDFVFQRNTQNTVSFARRVLTGGFQFFSQLFTKEHSTLDTKYAVCSRDGRLIVGGKPQAQYYIYALRRIRI